MRKEEKKRYERLEFFFFFFARSVTEKYTTLAKKIGTGAQAKHRRVHAREITRLRHVRAVVSIFLARVVQERKEHIR